MKFTEYRRTAGRQVRVSEVGQDDGGPAHGAGKTWKTYKEDMTTPCRHPEIGATDTTIVARQGDMYATRHNPFVYFHSIIDTPACAQHVVDSRYLDTDLESADTTPNLVFITPNLCHDGHDEPCKDGEPGGLTSADQFLAELVPKILASPAYNADGMLVITFDEARDCAACCTRRLAEHAEAGRGGRVAARLVISARSPSRGTTNATPYNHYALLCSLENVFGVPHLGFAAAPGLKCFGKDIYTRRRSSAGGGRVGEAKGRRWSRRTGRSTRRGAGPQPRVGERRPAGADEAVGAMTRNGRRVEVANGRVDGFGQRGLVVHRCERFVRR